MIEQLREIPRVRQIKGEPRRRWFSSLDLDLVVWLDQSSRPTSFQFCHGVGASEHAFTWHPEKGFDYARVDPGESGRVGYKGTPILQVNGAPNFLQLRRLFEQAASQVPPSIRSLVLQALTPRPPKPAVSNGPSPKSYPAKRRRK